MNATLSNWSSENASMFRDAVAALAHTAPSNLAIVYDGNLNATIHYVGGAGVDVQTLSEDIRESPTMWPFKVTAATVTEVYVLRNGTRPPSTQSSWDMTETLALVVGSFIAVLLLGTALVRWKVKRRTTTSGGAIQDNLVDPCEFIQ